MRLFVTFTLLIVPFCVLTLEIAVKDRVEKILDRATSMAKDAIDVDFDSPIGKEVAKLNEIVFPDTPKDEVKGKRPRLARTGKTDQN